MRLFIAIDLEELKDHFKELQNQIPKEFAKLNPVSSFHLTLRFLGDTDKAPEIEEELEKITFKPFKLHLDKIGVFPDESYIRVVWIGLKGDNSLGKLQKDIEAALEKFHFKKDFEFQAHITLARIKFISNRQGFIEKIKKIKIEPKEITINKFKLIESTLTRNGPVYEDIKVFEAD